MSYQFRRRSFLAGVGGAFGFGSLLRTMEAAAQGGKSPARLLMTHFPVGTLQQSYLPKGTQTAFTLSPILAPFQPLMADGIFLYGLRDQLTCPGGGGHEAGTPFTTTGASAPGTRANGGETDDGVAGGPSWDQILLKHVPGLNVPGPRYINVLCDARVDSLETSTQCLSYDYQTRAIRAANPVGATITEHTPLMPELSPAKAYATLFSGMIPGGGTPANMDAATKALKAKKSVLDHCLRDLTRVKSLAPGREAAKIDAHAAAIRNVEMQLTGQIAMAGGTVVPGGVCTPPASPPANLTGQVGGMNSNYNGKEQTTASDESIHEMIGKAHAAVILGAFQCDLIRVASFQWSPGTNHVSFGGKYPANPAGIYMHHPMSHKQSAGSFFDGPVLTGTGVDASVYQFLVAVAAWYNQKTADILTTFKTAKDGFNNSVLDYTVVPYLTEVGNASHARTNKPSMIFGGKALGLKGQQFLNFTSNRPQVDVWLTAAQAFVGANPLTAIPTSEKFNRTGAAPIAGLWAAPPATP